jgi:hypothetical protein|tara:strand:+ start:711 stop:1304 length:594 start_codon:yes stop_codon:yes gene_type:complete
VSKAQDNIRENLQKERFGLTGEHTRDDKYDAFYKMPVEFKTKAQDKGCTTKRRYADDPFKECVLVVSDYINKDTLSDSDWIVFPLALKEWREEQIRKLNFDNGTIPCYNEVDIIEEALGDKANQLSEIIIKFRNQVHRNDPSIPKTFFDTDGQFTYIKNKKVKVKHPIWMIRVPNDVDKARFLREKIEQYITFKNRS